MVSLTNIYDLLKSSCPYNVSFEEPTSYLQTIALAKNKCIFISEKEYVNAENNYENSYLTGSLLKNDCNFSDLEPSLNNLSGANDQLLWKKDEEYLKPIKLDKARSLLCDIRVQRKAKETNSYGDVWILCDASDYDKTVLLNLKFIKNFNSSGIVKFNGLVQSSKLNSIELMKLHKSLINNVIKTDITLESYYNIKQNIILKLNWSPKSRKFDLDNMNDAHITLYQIIRIDNPASICKDYWNQLIFLNSIKDDIVNYKMNTHSEIKYKSGTGIDMDLVKERIDSCLTEISSAPQPSNNKNETIEEVLMKLRARPSNDLTNKLWDVIKNCESYRDLKTAFNFIFQRAAQHKITNMPKNDNCLTKIICDIFHGRITVPCLSGTEPLELILEIGLEKLHEDYEFVFLESKISTSNGLELVKDRNLSNSDPKIDNSPPAELQSLLHSNKEKNDNTEAIGYKISKFNRQEIETKLNKLLKIHLTLEHLVCMQNNLNLENVSAYSQISEKLLNRKTCRLEELMKILYDKIEIPLPTDKIISCIESKVPYARRISIKSENKFREAQSIYYLNLENIFPPNIFPGFNEEDKEISTEAMYFFWNYVQIKCKMA